MKVLLVGRAAPETGGIAAFLNDLSSGPMSKMVDVELLNLTRPDETPRGGALHWTNVRRTIVDGWRVFRRARGCDVVHVHSALAPSVTMIRAGILVLCGRLAGRPVLMHAHGGLAVDWLRSRGARRLTSIALRGVARVVAVAASGEQALRTAVDPGRVCHIPNGVDLARFTPGSDGAAGPPRLLYVGLLSPRKGVLDLIAASAILTQRGVAHELVLVGGTPDEGPDHATQVIRAAQEGFVTLAGTVAHQDMPAVYRRAEVFCLPSWWEAMPLAMLEAMSSGLPIVATDVGAVGTVISGPQHGGTLLPPKSREALADALQPLLRDAGTRREWGARARTRAGDFDNITTAKALVALYNDVVAETA